MHESFLFSKYFLTKVLFSSHLENIPINNNFLYCTILSDLLSKKIKLFCLRHFRVIINYKFCHLFLSINIVMYLFELSVMFVADKLLHSN